MKCLFWMEVQNCLVKYYSESGIKQQSSTRKDFKVNKTYRYKDDDTGSEYILKPASEFKIDVQIDYNSKVLQKSSAQLNSLSDFNNEISDARTFVFLHEIKSLFEQGLIKRR